MAPCSRPSLAAAAVARASHSFPRASYTTLLYSRRCGNGHGLVRKYHMMLCRRCFRENADNIGFTKVS